MIVHILFYRKSLSLSFSVCLSVCLSLLQIAAVFDPSLFPPRNPLHSPIKLVAVCTYIYKYVHVQGPTWWSLVKARATLNLILVWLKTAFSSYPYKKTSRQMHFKKSLSTCTCGIFDRKHTTQEKEKKKDMRNFYEERERKKGNF